MIYFYLPIYVFIYAFLFGYSDIILLILSTSLAFDIFYHIWSYFYVQITNIHFHHLNVSLFIVTHVIMITSTHHCQYHQQCHMRIQQNFIQPTKQQSMILYKIFLLKNKTHMKIILQKSILIISNH